MKYFSMFSGIGGFELGIKRATNNQWECIGFSEVDKYAIETYKTHFKKHRNYGDATNINTEELQDFDFLCGGFPCQAFSIAGKRMGFEDTRGTLFFEIAKVIKAKQPRIVLLENVKGLLNHDNGRTFACILATLDELGYNAEWQVLNSKHYGVPQNRERVFIIGHSRKSSCSQIFPIQGTSKESIQSRGIQQIPNERYISRTLLARDYKDPKIIQLNNPRHSTNIIYSSDGIARSIKATAGGKGAKTGLYTIPVLTPMRAEKRQNGRRFKTDGEEMFTLTGQDQHGIMIPEATKKGYDIATEGDSINLSVPNSKTRRGRVGKGIAQTIDTGMMQHTIQDSQIRRLTPMECELLQGFPKGYTEFGIETFLNPETPYKEYGSEEKTNTYKILQILSKQVGKEERERWRLNEFITFFEKKILRQRMYEKRLQNEMEKKQSITSRIQLSSKTNSYFFKMRKMWLNEKHRHSPQRQKQIEQCFKELTISMQKLSQQNSSERIIVQSDSQRYKQCGNAVTVNVIQAIIEGINQTLENTQ